MEVFRDGTLSFRVLGESFRDAACVVLARAFCSEPNVAGRATLLQWFEFVDSWMDHCCANGLSVVAVDEAEHRVAGAFLVRDLAFFPAGFLQRYGSPEAALTPWMQFLLHLDGCAQAKRPELAGQGIVDLWFLGVHPDYTGRGVANVLMRETLPLVRSAGFRWATIEATSFFTSRAAKLHGFEPVVEVDSGDFVWGGVHCFKLTKEPHGKWIFWVKQLHVQ